MGFNKRFLPEIEELEKIRESMGSDSKFVYFFLHKPDLVIGSDASFQYLRDLEQSLKENQN